MISVIMPSFNTPVEMLSKAVDSVLGQTYRDFELIIIDDCSTDASVEYLASLQDERVKVIRNSQNLGITKSLNVGLSHARGEYIARMDSDDICLPERFAKQLSFMEAHPEVIVCGTWIQAFGDASYTTKRVIPEREYLRCSFLFGNAYGLCHPTAFFRGDMLRKYGIRYDENLPTAQDYGMWTTCAEYGEIANLEEVLLYYRVHNRQISVAKKELQKKCTAYTQQRLLRHIMPEITEEEIAMHFTFCNTSLVSKQMKRWFARIAAENEKCGFVDSQALSAFMKEFLREKMTSAAKTVRSPGKIIKLMWAANAEQRSVLLRHLGKRLFAAFRERKGRRTIP